MSFTQLVRDLLLRGRYRQVRLGVTILMFIIWWVAAGITQSDFQLTRRVGFYLLLPSTLILLILVFWFGYNVCQFNADQTAPKMERFWPPRRPLQVDTHPADVEQAVPGQVQEPAGVHRPRRESANEDEWDSVPL